MHFNFSLSYIKQALDNSDKIEIDVRSLRISFKRACPSERFSEINTLSQTTQTDETDVYKLFLTVIEQMRDIKRYDDYCGLLSAIASGQLRENIAFHLLLDVGQFFFS